jgi:hypothetical protein
LARWHERSGTGWRRRRQALQRVSVSVVHVNSVLDRIVRHRDDAGSGHDVPDACRRRRRRTTADGNGIVREQTPARSPSDSRDYMLRCVCVVRTMVGLGCVLTSHSSGSEPDEQPVHRERSRATENERC